ncbi:MAG: hypothetical protein HUU57_01625 [Bdellovibrio sp.]|nr:hypothetical protein [Bdellovibrio sp.]
MFKSQPSETHFLVITAVLVALMGIPTFHTLTAEETAPDELATAEIAPVQASSPVRSVASVEPYAVKPMMLTAYDVSCKKQGLVTLNVDGSYVQLQGKNCLKNFKTGDIEIVNKSNGYTASIFSSGNDQYQTDLIQLRSGDNEIAIRYRERSGKPVEEVIHIRSPKI